MQVTPIWRALKIAPGHHIQSARREAMCDLVQEAKGKGQETLSRPPILMVLDSLRESSIGVTRGVIVPRVVHKQQVDVRNYLTPRAVFFLRDSRPALR